MFMTPLSCVWACVCVCFNVYIPILLFWNRIWGKWFMFVNLVIWSVSVSLRGLFIIKTLVHCLHSSPEPNGNRNGEGISKAVLMAAGRSTGLRARPTDCTPEHISGIRSVDRPRNSVDRPCAICTALLFCLFLTSFRPSFFCPFPPFPMIFQSHYFAYPNGFRFGLIISNYLWSDDNHQGLSCLVVVYFPDSIVFDPWTRRLDVGFLHTLLEVKRSLEFHLYRFVWLGLLLYPSLF